MTKQSFNIKELTYIALGVAAIIAGGFIIFQVSMIFPFPGVKYIMMAPYLSMMFMVIQWKINRRFVLLKAGTVFGLIMLLFNLYMGMAIIVTAILAQSTSQLFPFKNRYFWASSLFSGYTGLSTLLISKYFIGGIYLKINMTWILVCGLICLLFGMAGAYYAKKIIVYIKRPSLET